MNILEPVEVKMGPVEQTKREQHVWTQIDMLKRGLQDITQNKAEKWRKIYEGKPKEDKKSFPWPGASNIVIQIAAQTVDTLVAQIIASIYEVMPIWSMKLEGDWEPGDQGEEQREALENFLILMGLEPHELDLYRVENIWFSNAAKYGMAVCKTPWEHQLEAVVTGVRDGTPIVLEETRYSGPRPEAVPFDKFGISPSASTLESADFKYHVVTLKKFQLLERKFRGLYAEDKVEAIIGQPDRYGPDANASAKQSDIGAKDATGLGAEEWDLYECHYPYWYEFQGQKLKFRIIETYHFKSKTSLKAIYNPYTANDEPFVVARLGYDDRGIYGYGFCEMLDHAQEEISAEHNRSADNNTLANTNALRVDPDSKLDSTFSLYPMAVLPFKQGEVEVIQLGRANNAGIDRENQMFSIIKARTGVDHGISGSGAGITNPKRGIYSTQGTMAVMQAGNRRSNIRITDMRTAHIEIGRKFLRQYAEFGIGERISRFGSMGKFLKMGLESYQKRRIEMPVRAATASVNREVEKQGDMMLVNIMRQHYGEMAAKLQQLGTVPDPQSKELIVDTIFGMDSLMRHILRNFGHDDISRLLPMPKFLKELRDGKGKQSAGGSGSTASENGGGNPLVQTNIPTQGENAQLAGGSGSIPVSGMAENTTGGSLGKAM